MKGTFTLSLTGKELFKKSIVYLIGYILVYIAYYRMPVVEGTDIGGTLLSVLLGIASMFFQYIILSTLFNSISFGEDRFKWVGEIGELFMVIIKGFLLSMISLGIYGPWFERNIIAYYADSIQTSKGDIAFEGTGGRLLFYITVGFIVPVFLVIIIATVAMGVDINSITPDDPILVPLGIAYLVGFLFCASLFYYLYISWFIDFSWNWDCVKVDLGGVKGVFFIFGQVLLSIISVGLYAPAANIKILDYIVRRVTITNREGVVSRVEFYGRTGEGFVLLLTRFLLSIITLGIYIPFAIVDVLKWVLKNIEVVGEDFE